MRSIRQSSINYVSILHARMINRQNWKPEQFKHSKVATNFNGTFKNSIFSSKQQNTQQKIISLIGKSYMADSLTTPNSVISKQILKHVKITVLSMLLLLSFYMST